MFFFRIFVSNISKPYAMPFCGFSKGGEKREKNEISAYTDGGPRSRVSARETLHSVPHRRELKFFDTHVCRVTFKDLPKSLKNHEKQRKT